MKFIKKIVLAVIFFSMFISNITYAKEISTNRKEISEKEFEVLSDSFMKDKLEKDKVVGATVSIVKDGKIFFKKGYGYADLENKVAVDPDNTLFEIGSTTKLFTATLAMKLIEEKKLDLNADVNNYLKDFKIKNKYNTPVTIKNLLTHTGGFDEGLLNIMDANGYYTDLKPLESYLKEDMPLIIREPGTCVQYSNYGMSLLGYIVQEVSKTPINEAIENNIFNKLNMNRSHYFLKKDLENNMAKPYEEDKSSFKKGVYTEVFLHPAGSIISTASDMANFMNFNLKNKAFINSGILQEKTLDLMHSTAFSYDKNIAGYALGFYEVDRNGYRVIEHGGDTLNYHTLLSIYPEENIGVFISLNTNSSGSSRLRDEYANFFYKQFLKENTNKEPSYINIEANSLKDFEGKYMNVRYTHNSPFKMLDFFRSKIEIKAIDNKGITVEFPSYAKSMLNLDKSEVIFKSISNDTFYNAEAKQYMKLFKKDGKYYFNVNQALLTGEKISKSENIITTYNVKVGGLLTLLAMLIILVSLIFKKLRSNNKNENLLRIILIIPAITLLALVIIIGILSVLSSPTLVLIRHGAMVEVMFRVLSYILLVADLVAIGGVIKLKMKQKLHSKLRFVYYLMIINYMLNIAFMYIMHGFF